VVIKRRVGELQDGLGHIMTGGLDGNVVVLLEVDAGMLLRRILGSSEQIPLQARVGGARDVLAVAPLAIARATRKVAATAATGSRRSTTAAGVAVRVGVKAAAAATACTPVVSLRGRSRSSARRREVARSVPATGASSGGWSTSVKTGIAVYIQS
jgi:hypothetical protein